MRNWRKSRAYRKWRVLVIRRDKVCQVCGSNKGRQAHHVNDGSNHPDGRYDIENGITLCGQCHMNFHCNYKKSYRQKCTRDDWDNFIQLVDYIKGLK